MASLFHAGQAGVIERSVAVTIVTFNSAQYITRCLESVFAQNYPDLQVAVLDNDSGDGTPDVLSRLSGIQYLQNARNNGFAGGQNQAIAATSSDWVLVLNPDVVLEPGFIQQLVRAGEGDSRIGTVCGKLLSMGADYTRPNPPVIDSTGMYFTPELRHFDRGSRQPDQGFYDKAEYVFGATGAAALYRRTMIHDVSIMGEFFDEDFFAYREDADLAWRAQLLGWRCLYTPAAVGFHVRSVLPSNRGRLSPVINMHSVKNRFLMRIKNATAIVYRRFWFRFVVRDLLVIAACLVREQSSLKAFTLIFQYWRRTIAKRKLIMSRRRVDDETVAAWFSKPVRRLCE